ncbi:hypothetical protein MOBT1_001716 [Malassezia obtusa]|uniref:Uncharacterized protein n=1 Tax=Malassezia obtusa TaxID=76774 RepID=A0AAF0E3U4_9BASI|nr:hypothetical protein MOBT1_001716 [Malassezia obtusa]
MEESARSGASPNWLSAYEGDFAQTQPMLPLRPKRPAAKASPSLDTYDEFRTKYRPDALISPALHHAQLDGERSAARRLVRSPSPRASRAARAARPGDVVRVTPVANLGASEQRPEYDPLFSPAPRPAPPLEDPRVTARREHDDVVESAVRHFDEMALPGEGDEPRAPTPPSPTPLSAGPSPLLVQDQEPEGLSPLQDAVYAQFAQGALDDHACVGPVVPVFVAVSMDPHAQGNEPRGTYAIYCGAAHPSNVVMPLRRKDIVQTARRTPQTEAAFTRRTELHGLIRALRAIVSQPLRRQCVHVCVSSAYIAKAWGTWIPEWETNGWPGDSDAESSFGGSSSSRPTLLRGSSQSSSVRTPNGSLDADMRSSPHQRSPRGDGEIRSMQAQRGVPPQRGTYAPWDLFSTPRRSVQHRRACLAGDTDSLASPTDSPLATESPNSSTRSRKTRRLVDEDLLRELALLRAQLAEADQRGGACVHLYLIERAHNPANLLALERPHSQTTTRAPVLRTRRSEPSLSSHAVPRSPVESVRSPALESVRSFAAETRPRWSRGRTSAASVRSPEVASPALSVGTPQLDGRSPRTSVLDRFPGRSPRLRQRGTPRHTPVQAPAELPAATHSPRPQPPIVFASQSPTQPPPPILLQPQAPTQAEASLPWLAQAQAPAQPEPTQPSPAATAPALAQPSPAQPSSALPSSAAPAPAPAPATSTRTASPALTAEALHEHNKRTQSPGKTSRTRGGTNAPSSERTSNGRSRLARWASRMFGRSDSGSQPPPTPKVGAQPMATSPQPPHASVASPQLPHASVASPKPPHASVASPAPAHVLVASPKPSHAPVASPAPAHAPVASPALAQAPAASPAPRSATAPSTPGPVPILLNGIQSAPPPAEVPPAVASHTNALPTHSSDNALGIVVGNEPQAYAQAYNPTYAYAPPQAYDPSQAYAQREGYDASQAYAHAPGYDASQAYAYAPGYDGALAYAQQGHEPEVAYEQPQAAPPQAAPPEAAPPASENPRDAPQSPRPRRRMPRSAHASRSQPDLRSRARSEAARDLPRDVSWLTPRRTRESLDSPSTPVMTRGMAWLASEEALAQRHHKAPSSAWDSDHAGFGRAEPLPTTSPYARNGSRSNATYAMLGAERGGDTSESDSDL